MLVEAVRRDDEQCVSYAQQQGAVGDLVVSCGSNLSLDRLYLAHLAAEAQPGTTRLFLRLYPDVSVCVYDSQHHIPVQSSADVAELVERSAGCPISCPQGSVAAYPNECSPCPAGHSCLGADELSDIRIPALCRPGTFAAAGDGRCSPVRRSFYTRTAEGAIGAAGAVEQRLCQAGSACPGSLPPGQREICDGASYSSGPGATVCTPCTAYSHYVRSAAPAPGNAACLSCPPRVSWCLKGARRCMGAPGYYGEGLHPEQFRRCPPGHACPGTGGRHPCEPGFYQPSAGVASCAGPCGPGLVAADDLGTVVEAGATSCVSCPPGQVCRSGIIVENCFGDTYAHAGSDKCEACPAGHVVIKAASRGSGRLNGDCMPCMPGSFAAEAGKTDCEPCPAGSVARGWGNDGCDPAGCEAGSYLADRHGAPTLNGGAAVCAVCPPGSACSDGRIHPCAAGTHAPRPGVASCTPCPADFPSEMLSSGPVTCEYCPLGSFRSHSATPPCQPCAAIAPGVAAVCKEEMDAHGTKLHRLVPCPPGHRRLSVYECVRCAGDQICQGTAAQPAWRYQPVMNPHTLSGVLNITLTVLVGMATAVVTAVLLKKRSHPPETLELKVAEAESSVSELSD